MQVVDDVIAKRPRFYETTQESRHPLLHIKSYS